jgi:hypothetical protein
MNEENNSSRHVVRCVIRLKYLYLIEREKKKKKGNEAADVEK